MTECISRLAVLGAALSILGGCAYLQFGAKPEAPPVSGPAGLALQPAEFSDLPGWQNDRQAEALPAILKSCAKIGARALNQPVGAAGVGGLTADWRKPCQAALGIPAGNHAATRYFLETWFRPYLATASGEPEGLFTGYYEAELRGSRQPSKRFGTPIHMAPPDLKTVKAGAGGRYLTRSQIAGGALKGRNLELMWVDDPVDAFMLHVQGSGRAVMEDGRVIRLGYAADNGHKYVSIGRELVRRGVMPMSELSADSLRAWIHANPLQGANLMAQNPRYIFFRELAGQEGPIGAQGVALTEGRSLAVDRAFVPLGVPLWVDTLDPLNPNRPLRRLMVAQDVGSAIKGPVRGDIFFGFGDEPARRAGNMKARGRYHLLLPKTIGAPTS